MNMLLFKTGHFRTLVLIMATVSLLLSGCGSNAKKEDEQTARYAELEGDLLRANEEQEIRRRNEMRVAEKLRQLSAGRADKNNEGLDNGDFSRSVTPIFIEENSPTLAENSTDQNVSDGINFPPTLSEPPTERLEPSKLADPNIDEHGEGTEEFVFADAGTDNPGSTHGNLKINSERMAETTTVQARLSVTDNTPVKTPVNTPENERGMWTYKEHPNPVSGKSACAVVSDTIVVLNGTLDTHVNVIIMTDAIYLRTDATFDINASDTGYRVDAGFPVSFNTYANELTAVVDEDYDRLYQMITSGLFLTVDFVYMPQLADSATHRLELNLDLIEGALDELDACRAPESTVKDG